MARTRNIKPAFFDNDTLGGLDPLVRLLFIGLWCIADRDGRLEDRPRRIKKTLLGYDDVSAEETSGMLQQLADEGFIIRYEAEGKAYIQIVTFSKHQNPNMKEKGSEIPPPPGFEDGSYQRHSEEPEPAEHEPQQPKTRKAERPAEEQQPKESGPSLQEERFEQFWKAYPNKKKKEIARKSWAKIKPDADLFRQIMDGLQRAKDSWEWQKNNGQYIPHPPTWLNGHCWEDEYSSVGQPDPPQQGGRVSTMDVLGDIINEQGAQNYD